MLLLGFGNKARNGKDTAAEAITRYYSEQNDLLALHGFQRAAKIRIGTFKYATALYQEVSDAIAAGIWKHRQVGSTIVDSHVKKYVELPDWVQPNPNSEPSELAPYGKHPKLLQWWGTEYRRNLFGQDYWIKKLFATIPANLDVAMITDVRFIDEADAIKQRGGYTINVQRLREDGTQYFSDDRPADHPSETQLDGYNWDFYIKTPHGHAALTGEIAITYAEYLRGLKR